MTPETIRELAEQIVNEQFFSWRFYVLLAALAFLSALASNFLAAYARKRAELYATKADMDEVLNQLKATTHVAEQVRVAVSHADWVAREWRTTRRLKLEELMTTAYALDRWLEEQQSKWVYQKTGGLAVGEGKTEPDPIDRLKLIGSLYFPEVRDELLKVQQTHRALHSAILATATKAIAAQKDMAAYQAALEEMVKNWQPLYTAAVRSLAALESKASGLMREIAEAWPPDSAGIR